MKCESSWLLGDHDARVWLVGSRCGPCGYEAPTIMSRLDGRELSFPVAFCRECCQGLSQAGHRDPCEAPSMLLAVEPLEVSA